VSPAALQESQAARRAKVLYERRIRERVETQAENERHFVTVDVESGDLVVANDAFMAGARLRRRSPRPPSILCASAGRRRSSSAGATWPPENEALASGTVRQLEALRGDCRAPGEGLSAQGEASSQRARPMGLVRLRKSIRVKRPRSAAEKAWVAVTKPPGTPSGAICAYRFYLQNTLYFE
jgi:hypothetical protein